MVARSGTIHRPAVPQVCGATARRHRGRADRFDPTAPGSANMLSNKGFRRDVPHRGPLRGRSAGAFGTPWRPREGVLEPPAAAVPTSVRWPMLLVIQQAHAGCLLPAERTALPSYQVDLASGTRLIGGEMAGWSDLTAQNSAGAVTCLLEPVLRAARSAPRILLLGPRASRLLEDLPADAEVDVLVRGLGDARHLAALSGLRARGAIHCGGLDRFAAAGTVRRHRQPRRPLRPDVPGLARDRARRAGAAPGHLARHRRHARRGRQQRARLRHAVPAEGP